MAAGTVVNGLIAAVNALKAYFEGIRASIDQGVDNAEQKMDAFIAQQKVTGYTTSTDEDDTGSWDRVFSISHRIPVQVTIGTKGGWFAPGSVTFHMLIDYSGNLSVNTLSKLASQYVTKIRVTTDNNSTGPSFVEIFIPHRHRQANEVTVEAIANVLPNISFVNEGVNLVGLTKTTPEVLL